MASKPLSTLRKELTERKRRKIAAALLLGYSLRTVALLYGVSPSTAWSIGHERGVLPRPEDRSDVPSASEFSS